MVWSNFQRSHQVFVWLTSIFVVSLVIANLTGAMLFSFNLPVALPIVGSAALLSAGIIPFPVTFILTDLINEYYGKSGARFVSYVGLAMSVLVFGYLSIGEWLPVAKQTVIPRTHFLSFSSNYANMFVASLTAYLIGQMLDIWVFGVFRGITQNRLIWLRATGSTVISQIFDSLIVTSLAFWGNLPANEILRIAASNYVWKFAIAIGITPLLYAGHFFLKKLLSEHLQGEV